jgi:hypothetical protein
MICLDYFVRTPEMAALTGGVATLIYFLLTSFSTTLPPALLSSIVVGYFIYISMGGRLLCQGQGTSATQTPVVAPLANVQPSMERTVIENPQRIESRIESRSADK